MIAKKTPSPIPAPDGTAKRGMANTTSKTPNAIRFLPAMMFYFHLPLRTGDQ